MRRNIAGLFFTVVGVLSFFYFINSTPHEATMVFVNGIVYTLDANNSIAQAVAIRGNKIVDVGSSDELKRRYMGTKFIDLQGKTIMPGFIDAHAHIAGLGQLMQSLILVGMKSSEEIISMVRERAQQIPSGQWLYGRGWDQNLWEVKQFPTASQLDAGSADRPVVLVRIDGHAIWVNTMAMQLAGITRETKDPDGGKIIRDAGGNPTGVFVDNARDLVENFVPPKTPDEIERNILVAAEECARNGLTEVHDMGIDSLQIAIYKKLVDEGKLPIRIYGAISVPSATWNFWNTQPPLIHYGNGMFTVRAMKMYEDGALGSRGAALVEEYSDDPGNRGTTIATDNELQQNIRIALEHGYQPSVHAIGDRGNHVVLNAYEKVLNNFAKGDYRPRIEHAQVVLPEDIPRFKKLGVLPSMQPIHATSDMYWAEARVGPQRIRGAYAWRSFLATGSIIPGGSDFPNDGMSPLWGFYAAFTRSDRTGYPQDGWYRDQKMTRDEAARCFTQWAAYASFEENLKGSIEIGKWADLTILSKDIMQIPPPEILTTEVVMTIVNGKIVYQKESAQ
jgi:predicted amidohydrolase YtcJ